MLTGSHDSQRGFVTSVGSAASNGWRPHEHGSAWTTILYSLRLIENNDSTTVTKHQGPT